MNTYTPLSSPDMPEPYGLIPCPECEGKGFVQGAVAGGRLTPCFTCHRTCRVLSWWRDAFHLPHAIHGPLLTSAEDTLDQRSDPAHIRWSNGVVAWKTITHLSQFTATRFMNCRMPDEIGPDGKPRTFVMRSSPNGMAFETTKIHLPHRDVVMGLPYPLVLKAWMRFLRDEKAMT